MIDSEWMAVSESGDLALQDGARVAVIGGGPAGSFFSYFLLDLAKRVDLNLHVDIFEPRDFSLVAPRGCNMCGGIISESLVQHLATEGINLPPTVVQRGIDAYYLHTDSGDVCIRTPLDEKRIASVYRGSGPRDLKELKWGSFDQFLQEMAVEQGANVIRKRVAQVTWQEGYPYVEIRGESSQKYDLAVIACGVNSAMQRLLSGVDLSFQPPQTTTAYIHEYYLGEETIRDHLGSAMHVFLLDIPRLEFAALIPKGDYVSLCLLGESIDNELVQQFLQSPQVRNCMPDGFDLERISCHCSPRINIAGATSPYADRLVFVGDCAVTRLYKDGIGGAYRTAKAAASAAVLYGVGADNFATHYQPICDELNRDNRVGKFVFAVTRIIQRLAFAKRGMLRMVYAEQDRRSRTPHMSLILWDTFTGSAPYTEILLRTLHPAYWLRFIWHLAIAAVIRPQVRESAKFEAIGESR